MDFETGFIGMTESFLFVAGEEGLTLAQLATLLECDEQKAEQVLISLQAAYDEDDTRGITLKSYGGSYRLVTKSEWANDIKRMLEDPKPSTFTQAALEVLAIIAYKQPVTRVEIDDLRGVKSERALSSLAAKGFVEEVGRMDGPGRPILYGTTAFFLDRFGLASLEDMPPLSIDEEQETSEETDLFMTKFQEAFSNTEEGGHDA
ncbi:SMC-Scp complex subunit ScpB [Sporosarcina sp. P26b]|uniref:SMC-Scp complex subunit ScpB n=1 Tax=unclassified Sporosarcina TaxID=2647733 RepID=UPI000C166D9E|nr:MULTISPECIES: SMC-Scp complex subunit ScpB [unclassified Sporosarcina]PIC75341.1 SMC-Scp complex subunit ScpB [Sporosarcina sp. P17b]PIC97306.1 SMC-Scp complex subunit ScpB [Sporosarcina sp. P26b]